MKKFHQTHPENFQEKIAREQREFENHWLWRELNTTPAAFFAMVDECVARNGIDRDTWNRKIADARKEIENRATTARHSGRGSNLPLPQMALRA